MEASGAQCVMTTGMTEMLRWCADNLDIHNAQVNYKSKTTRASCKCRHRLCSSNLNQHTVLLQMQWQSAILISVVEVDVHG